MNHWSIYSTVDGIFTGVAIGCNTSEIVANIPDAHSCIIGDYDKFSQRVDLATGIVVDYQPPQPSENHAWDTATRRWLYIKTDADIALDARTRRDKLLTACDWMAARAIDGIPVPENWQAYRTALRNISEQASFPRSVAWPVAPA